MPRFRWRARFRGDQRFPRVPQDLLVIGVVDNAALFGAGLVYLALLVFLGRFLGEHETDDLHDFGTAWAV